MNVPNYKDLMDGFEPKREFKPLDDKDLKKLGISRNEGLRIVENLEELEEYPPNIVIGECKRNMEFIQNNSQSQYLRKGQRYVLPISLYQKLHYDVNRKLKILSPANAKFYKLYKKYKGEDLTNKTILFWRTGGVGDLLFIKPNLDYIKEKYPSCKIILACGPQYQSMVKMWSEVDKVISLPFTISKLLNSDYHAIFEGVIERTIESRYTNSYELFTKWLGLNLPTEKLRPRQNPNQDILHECKNILSSLRIEENGFILVQISASSPIRTPSRQSIAKLIEEITNRGYKVIINDSPNKDQEINHFIKFHLNNNQNVYKFTNYSKSISYPIALASLAKASVSVDSALVHISESVGTPIFGIYGPFRGEERMSTYSMADWINCGENLECAPCNKHGGKPCHFGYPKCYDETLFDEARVSEIVNRIEKLIREKEDD